MSTTTPGARARTRLTPEARRRQLLDVAARLITERGVDGLQMSDLAAAAGVTRPVVYRYFENRAAVLVGVMEDFEETLEQRFLTDGLRSITGSRVQDIAAVFVDAVCDSIEDRGAGAWHLLTSNGPDPALAEQGRVILERIVSAWHGPIRGLTGATEREVTTASTMLLAAGGAALQTWLDGEATRDEAVEWAARGIEAILVAFTRPDSA